MIMSKLPKISDMEWEVMKVIWQDFPVSAGEVIDRLGVQNSKWHPRTVKTLLNRLVGKKALGFKKEGRAYLYRPLVSEKECVRVASESFLDRVFGGSLKPMLAHMIEQRRLSPSEIEDLKRILEGKEKSK
jgi:BlaI family penicillinase repressor